MIAGIVIIVQALEKSHEYLPLDHRILLESVIVLQVKALAKI